MIVTGVGDSTTYTFTDKLKSIHQYQATLKFEDLERVDRIEKIARQDPNVQAVEIWYTSKGDMRPAMQAESSVFDQKATLLGVPTSTTMYTPEIRAGRWLVSTDTNAMVLHIALANEIGVTVDDWITLDDAFGYESRWQVVGLLFDPMSDSLAFTLLAPLQTEIGQVNKANTVWLKTRQTDQDSANNTVKNLQTLFNARNMTVEPSSLFNDFTIDDISTSQLARYDTIVLLLAGMAVLIAVVGGVGLSGMLSLSVLERRREIGVMRAIGASSGVILRLFIGEGLTVGLLELADCPPLQYSGGLLGDHPRVGSGSGRRTDLPIHAFGTALLAGSYHRFSHSGQLVPSPRCDTNKRTRKFNVSIGKLHANQKYWQHCYYSHSNTQHCVVAGIPAARHA